MGLVASLGEEGAKHLSWKALNLESQSVCIVRQPSYMQL